MEWLDESGDGMEGAEKAGTLLPEIVLLDIGMPRLNGIEATKKIRQSCPNAKIVVLTQERDREVGRPHFGRRGCLPREDACQA